MKTSTQFDDTQLVHLFQQGDNNALEILVNRHKDKIFTSILIMVEDRYLAEDLFQEVFIKIINTLRAKTYNDEGKFSSWALRIAHNLCIDYFRKVKRTPMITNNNDEEVFGAIGFIDDNAEKTMVRRENHDEVRQALQMLSEEQREVIILRHYADMSFKEIAKLTNCSVNTALGRMRYALQSLRKIMAEKQAA